MGCGSHTKFIAAKGTTYRPDYRLEDRLAVGRPEREVAGLCYQMRKHEVAAVQWSVNRVA